MIRSLLRTLAVAALAALLPITALAQDGKPQSLPVTRIRVGTHPVDAEVAQDPQQRSLGLMFRFNLPADRGMLFVFPRAEPLGFWMRNTYIPLSIAYLDAGGTILNILDMKPHDESPHPSAGPALYALEMRRGWFAERGIGPGTRVTGLPPAAKY